MKQIIINIAWFFQDKDGSFSWRKGLTALIGLVFAFCCIGYCFGLKELPIAYISIIGGVFTFYFTKELFTKKIKQ